MGLNIRTFIILLASILLTGSIHAADMRWSGFGTLGAGQVLDDGALYNANPILIDGDLDDEITFNTLSVVGLQSDVNFGNGLSATIQFKAIGAENWNADVAWAYVTYDLTSTLKVQAGRKLLPIYNYTDSIDVSYTYHWIRTPADVYSVGSIRYDGVNLTFQDFFGDWEFSANGLIGRVENDENLFEDFSTSYRVYGGNIEAVYDDWIKLRVALIEYKEFKLEGEIAPGIELDAFDPSYYGTSISLTPGNWLLMTEYTWYDVNVDNFIPGVPGTKLLNSLDEAWYVTAAYTSGKWTPHLTYSHREFTDEGFNLGNSSAETSTLIAGVRYDFHPSSSLKFEYHRRDDDTKNNGVDAPRGGFDSVDIIQVAIDFIF